MTTTTHTQSYLQHYPVNSEQDTEELATRLAHALLSEGVGGTILYLEGDLGCGKTTFCRYLLHGIGHTGSVKSPTYTLVEPYQIDNISVFHFDLYRLNDPEELEFMGIRDYFSNTSCCLIEWPEKGFGLLPAPDLHITINFAEGCRTFSMLSNSNKGKLLISSI